MSTPTTRIIFHTMGCKTNFSETSIISGEMQSYGCEKISYKDTIIQDKERMGLFVIGYCTNFNVYGDQCLNVFQALTADVIIEADDIVTNQWMILREFN